MKNIISKTEHFIYESRCMILATIYLATIGLAFGHKFKAQIREVPCSSNAKVGAVPQWFSSTNNLHVLKSFPKKEIPALIDAVNEWNEVGIYKIVLIFDYLDLKSGITGYNTIGMEHNILNDELQNQLTQAITKPKYFFLVPNKGYIVGSDIVINGKQNLSGIDMRTLLRHELGHFLGLQHKEDDSELMNPTLGIYSVRKIGEWDKSQLRCVAGIKYNENDNSLASKTKNPKDL